RARAVDVAVSRVGHVDGEDPLALRRRRNRPKRRPLPRLPDTLVVAEEDLLVFDDRSADDPAELVAIEGGLAGRGLEEPGRVHRRIAEELPGGSVQSIGAAAVVDVDRRARGAPVLGAQVV